MQMKKLLSGLIVESSMQTRVQNAQVSDTTKDDQRFTAGNKKSKSKTYNFFVNSFGFGFYLIVKCKNFIITSWFVNDAF
jgi:hypothetical protein